LEEFVAALRSIVEEARTDPDLLRSAPHSSPVRRLDETTAARQPNLRWKGMTGDQTPCPD
jgi:glycine dehydrogenase subunit 2